MDAFDHRILGSKLDLFHQRDEGPGTVFWHPRGMALLRVVEEYVRVRMRAAGFAEVRTPQLLARALWEQSGHWEKFGDQMFTLDGDDGRFCLKPMSCPGHVLIFKKGSRSYRDLPVRYAEFGAVHRAEPSGALHGLMRARAFTQDDAHVLCAPAQVEAEVVRFCALLASVYADFGFDAFEVALSTRPAQRAGDDASWDRAEAQLAAAARAAGLRFTLQPGEGAFYGPKLEFHLIDRRGRKWQCGTVQLDFVLPERLGATYVDEKGEKRVPVMIHHAVLGSLERFIGILLEHYEGWLPAWLAPDQVVVASIGEAQRSFADQVAQAFESIGCRVARDFRAERLPRKIVDARALAAPILAIAGSQEARDGTVALRLRNGEQQVLPLDEALACVARATRVPLRTAPRVGNDAAA
ncbi:threonine--tRNA ligase [Burkholderia sp. FERM BP-3421]|jgi:threonyl-tRNA synthetase|uniref:threonine--tRNA ligase n=1 Tax=Burkholderia sp. FERM BP-3421 TaxID=1494466 RepID=UPI00236045E1|nr:threonine--tRNA ligase [Burkholderia sp. FERM BP-3421]WDD91687.1 threonine--tRNA ligase [Burkholderia sp. FERM BP-3421]